MINTLVMRIAIAVIVMLAGFAAYFISSQKTAKITELQQTVRQKDEKISEVARALSQVETSTKVDETIQLDATIAKQEATQQHDTVLNKVREKVIEIKHQFTQQPVTSTAQRDEADQVSKTRIEGLWSAYCLVEPTQVNCHPSSR